MKYISYIFLFFSTISWAQQAPYQAILKTKPDSIPKIALPTDSLSVCLKMNFANSQVLNLKDYEPLRGQTIEEVTLVYTSYHTPTFDQVALNRQRLKVLQAFAPEIFQQFPLRWRIVAQTAATSKMEGDALFHGFIIRCQEKATTVDMDLEIDYLKKILGDELAHFENPNISEDSILRIADRMPSFGGDQAEKRRYFDRNLKYPEQALKMGKEGTVLVSIIVDEKGNITNATLLRGFDAECDQEALRLVKEMPKWNPGMQGDDFVKVKLTYPVNL
jgi:TonB family protein